MQSTSALNPANSSNCWNTGCGRNSSFRLTSLDGLSASWSGLGVQTISISQFNDHLLQENNQHDQQDERVEPEGEGL